MKIITKSIRISLLALVALAIAPAALHAQHAHLAVGVKDTNTNNAANAGDQLGFKNGNDWAYDFIGDSGYTHNSGFASNVGNSGVYYGTAYNFAITPFALYGDSGRNASITAGGVVTYNPWENFGVTANGSLAVAGAHAGSFLQLQLVSVELLSGTATSFGAWGGVAAYPAAGTLPYAEWTFAGPGAGTLVGGSQTTIDLTSLSERKGTGDTQLAGARPTYPNAFAAQDVTDGFAWNVDDNGGSPDRATAIDPYGHLHGRSYATNGADSVFKLTFKAVDLNGLHPDSDVLTMRWESVPEPTSAALLVAAGVGVAGLRRFRRIMRLR